MVRVNIHHTIKLNITGLDETMHVIQNMTTRGQEMLKMLLQCLHRY